MHFLSFNQSSLLIAASLLKLSSLRLLGFLHGNSLLHLELSDSAEKDADVDLDGQDDNTVLKRLNSGQLHLLENAEGIIAEGQAVGDAHEE